MPVKISHSPTDLPHLEHSASGTLSLQSNTAPHEPQEPRRQTPARVPAQGHFRGVWSPGRSQVPEDRWSEQAGGRAPRKG